ncbi:hypothetical protein CXB51_002365 [Gossypium anomalum]|uniref:DUF4283 domain-containing protein n=1 Tax=Gossypium anomalum TaxID=47600 RepID=A0A8J5Z6V4_9ROSI|nr:hypothetical protein CXB51_002365 [Gossypium anomalum]
MNIFSGSCKGFGLIVKGLGFASKDLLEADVYRKKEQNQDENLKSLGKNCDGDLEFLEGDVKKSMVNNIPAIEFSKRIQQILFKGMETTVVLKLLSWNIGYAALFNQISSLWRPTKPFHIMDIENNYFLAKLQCIEDYNKAISQRPWIIYGQYLIVHPWKKYFNPMKSYPSMVLAWIRLLGLLGFMYKRRILEEVGGLVGRVVKFDLNTDSKTRGCFARMVVFVNLNKPLVSQVMVNREMKRVEY